MAIAIDCTVYRKGKVGGFESYLHNLLDGFAIIAYQNSLNEKIHLFIREDEINNFEQYSSVFECIPVKIASVFKRITWQNFVLPFYSNRYRVILFPGNVRPLILKTKAITVIHDIQYLHFPQYWPKMHLIYRKIMIPYSLKHSEHIITISNAVASELKQSFKYFDSTKLSVIYNPITLNQTLEQKPGNEYGIIEGGFLLIPSSLAKHKNLPNLVEAIKHLNSIGLDNIRYVFIGAFSADKFIGSTLPFNVTVLGYVSYEMRNWLFNNCMGVLLPSIYEGFGMPYAEALFAGKPVIASDIPISREILEDNAYYIPYPYSASEISSSIMTFMQNKNNWIHNRQKSQKLKKDLEPKNVAKKYFDLLTSL